MKHTSRCICLREGEESLKQTVVANSDQQHRHRSVWEECGFAMLDCWRWYIGPHNSQVRRANFDGLVGIRSSVVSWTAF